MARTLTGAPQRARVANLSSTLAADRSDRRGASCVVRESGYRRKVHKEQQVLTELPPADPIVQDRPHPRARLLPALIALAGLAAAGAYVVPHGLEAQNLLSIEDDPAKIAEREVAQKFNADVA